MNRRRMRSIMVAGATLFAGLFGVAGPAGADTPLGTCTNSYTAVQYGDLSFDPSAQAIFAAIDTNHDGWICFKLYTNGPHNGHYGNLVDDKAAPHS